MIMLCHHFTVVCHSNASVIVLIVNILLLVDDDHTPSLPLVDDHQAPANERTDDNPMDVEIANGNLVHIPGVDDTTLLSNVSDEFILPPISTAGKVMPVKVIDLTCLCHVFEAQMSTVRQVIKRKRKLIIDEMKEIDSASMKTQLSDTTDIVGVLELAPPTRRLMFLKETGGIEKLFALSATSIYSKTLQQVRRNEIASVEQVLYAFVFSSSLHAICLLNHWIKCLLITIKFNMTWPWNSLNVTKMIRQWIKCGLRIIIIWKC
jgi:hypothetical protein